MELIGWLRDGHSLPWGSWEIISLLLSFLLSLFQLRAIPHHSFDILFHPWYYFSFLVGEKFKSRRTCSKKEIKLSKIPNKAGITIYKVKVKA